MSKVLHRAVTIKENNQLRFVTREVREKFEYMLAARGEYYEIFISEEVRTTVFGPEISRDMKSSGMSLFEVSELSLQQPISSMSRAHRSTIRSAL